MIFLSESNFTRHVSNSLLSNRNRCRIPSLVISKPFKDQEILFYISVRDVCVKVFGTSLWEDCLGFL